MTLTRPRTLLLAVAAALAALAALGGCVETPPAIPPQPAVAPSAPPPDRPRLVGEYTFDAGAAGVEVSPAVGSGAGSPDLALTMRSAGGAPVNLRSKAGKGPSGAPGDLAFDNSAASGMGGLGGAAVGGRLLGDKEGPLHAVTIQGWFKPVAGQTLGNGAVLFTSRRGDAGLELSAKTGGTLTLGFGDGRTWREVSSPQVYTESGNWMFFAVTLVTGTGGAAGTGKADPGRVVFYKGSATMPVRQVQQAEDAGGIAVGLEAVEGFSIGALPDGSKAFRGWIDSVRVYLTTGEAPAHGRRVSALPLADLEVLRCTDLLRALGPVDRR